MYSKFVTLFFNFFLVHLYMYWEKKKKQQQKIETKAKHYPNFLERIIKWESIFSKQDFLSDSVLDKETQTELN